MTNVEFPNDEWLVLGKGRKRDSMCWDLLKTLHSSFGNSEFVICGSIPPGIPTGGTRRAFVRSDFTITP